MFLCSSRLYDLRMSPTQVFVSCGATYVCVYGTLRAGGVNDISHLQSGICCVGRTYLTGTLHDLGWYPGLSLQGTHQVLAEVYPLNAMLEQELDRVEGIWPQDVGEYVKRLVDVNVRMQDGSTQTMNALVYEAQASVLQHAPIIDASDWLAWYEDKGKPHSEIPFALKTRNSAAP